MTCCNHKCSEGRDCPERRESETSLSELALFIAAVIVLSLAVWYITEKHSFLLWQILQTLS